MHGKAVGLILMTCLLGGSEAAARQTAKAGVEHYQLLEQEMAQGNATSYRFAIDLVTDGKGGVVALVRTAETKDGQNWTAMAVPEDCKKEMRVPEGSVARAPLWPTKGMMDASFMPSCVPDPLFHSMTDVLNIALIQYAPQFHARDLERPGQTLAFDGFSASWDRGHEQGKIAAAAGEITLQSLDHGRATFVWKPGPMALSLVEHNAQMSFTIDGVERFAFEVVVDRRTGILESGRTLSDEVDGTITLPGGQKPPLKASRMVSMQRVH